MQAFNTLGKHFFQKKKKGNILILFLLLSAPSHQCLCGAGRNAHSPFHGRGLRKACLHLQSPAVRPPHQAVAGSPRAPSAHSPWIPVPSASGPFLSNPHPPSLRPPGPGYVPRRQFDASFGTHRPSHRPGCTRDSSHPLDTPGLTHRPGLRQPTLRPCNGNGAGHSARPRGGRQRGGLIGKNSALVDSTKPGGVAWAVREMGGGGGGTHTPPTAT